MLAFGMKPMDLPKELKTVWCKQPTQTMVRMQVIIWRPWPESTVPKGDGLHNIYGPSVASQRLGNIPVN